MAAVGVAQFRDTRRRTIGEQIGHQVGQVGDIDRPTAVAIHIPFLLRFPRRVQADRRTKAMFSSVDVMPTLLGLCGLDVPEGVQGHNLAHIATGEEGLIVMEILDALYQSAATGKPVHIV